MLKRRGDEMFVDPVALPVVRIPSVFTMKTNPTFKQPSQNQHFILTFCKHHVFSKTTLTSTCVTPARSPMASLRPQTPDSRLQISDSGLRLQTPDSRFQTPDSRFQAPDARLQTPNSRLQGPDWGVLPPGGVAGRLSVGGGWGLEFWTYPQQRGGGCPELVCQAWVGVGIF